MMSITAISNLQDHKTLVHRTLSLCEIALSYSNNNSNTLCYLSNIQIRQGPTINCINLTARI